MIRRKFTIVSAYDTETTNIGNDENARAFPILFIDNDLRDVNLREYEPGTDKVNFYRYESEMIDRIAEYIDWGMFAEKVPIICAYNLIFDLQPLLYELNRKYDIKVNAQSSTNLYTLDLYEQDSDKMLLRFWDTFHLEMRGLAAMGMTAGLPKADGDWDYSLIRTSETPLTEAELGYAKRDVQVIPAYLKYLLNANEWMNQSDLGVRVLTKTSIVRQMARRNIANITIDKQNGKKLTLDKAFTAFCKKELPKNFNVYGLRKACFRGGYTFTAAKYAGELQRNVIGLDVTSMHHTFINGRYVPQDFKVASPIVLENACEEIMATSLESVLENYHKPFNQSIHARIRFKNIRLKKDTVFSEMGIALLATSKFKNILGESYKGDTSKDDDVISEMNVIAENVIRRADWHDVKINAECAFGKLYTAEEITVHVTEVELWCISRVYEWDSMEVIGGEISLNFKKPPDFVTLQSNMLFEQKSAAKFISEHYEEGTPYPYNLTNIPNGLSATLKDGSCDEGFFNSWYSSTVKGMFNGIYGTMAQDIYKGNYKCDSGEIIPDEMSVVTEDNWDESQPNTTRVLYTYGMRIVGGSRMHMVIAMELLYKEFGNKVHILGGDTDSIKCAIPDDVTPAQVSQALASLGVASKRAIDMTMERVRKEFPKLASTLKGIGSFEIENEVPYQLHLELWNKCRVSYDGKFHVTCAGLRRPMGMKHIETLMLDLANAGYDPGEIMLNCMGYDVFAYHEISHVMEHHRPRPNDLIYRNVTDYLGNTCLVQCHESIALYPTGRWIGEYTKMGNRDNVDYLKKHYNRDVLHNITYLYYRGEKPYVEREGKGVIMHG